jgi:hypothetical protein
MSTISGSYSVVVTLDAGSPHVAVTGTVDAYGSLGMYGGQTVSGAVFGAAGTDFLVHNSGFIESGGDSARDGGIVLGSAGTVLNGGTVFGGSGIVMFGGGVVENNKLVEGSVGAGIYLSGGGTAINAGILTAGAVGVSLVGGGYVENTGHVVAGTGIAVTSCDYAYVYNTGNILATTGDGVTLSAFGVVSNAGSVQAGADGVALGGAGYVYNYGVLQGSARGVDLQSGGSVYNSKRIKGGIGVYAKDGAGYVYNYASAQITGTTIGVELTDGGVIGNDGTITGASTGILLTGGGVVGNTGKIVSLLGTAVSVLGQPATIMNSGVLVSNNYAIALESGGTVDNSGTVEGGTYLQAGGVVLNTGTIGNVTLEAGGTLDNRGTSSFIYGYGGAAVVNYGYVQGRYFRMSFGNQSIDLKTGSDATNFGTIKAGGVGIELTGAGTVANDGLIFGKPSSLYLTSSTGIELFGGGTAVNAGTIDTSNGINVFQGGTVIDTGTIDAFVTYGGASALGSAIYFQASYANRLILSPTALNVGTVNLGGGVLELAAGNHAGTITVSSSQVTGFGSIQVDAGANWGFRGATRLGTGVTVTNDGTILQGAGSKLSIGGAVDGTGTIDMGNKGLELDGSVSSGQRIRFTGLGETLALGDAPGFAGTIGAFGPGETIVLDGLQKRDVTGLSLTGNVLTIDTVGGAIELTFSNASSFGTETFHDFKAGGGVGISLSSGGQMAFLAQSGTTEAAGVTAGSYLPAAASGQPLTPPANYADNIAGWLSHDLLKPVVSAVPVTFHV